MHELSQINEISPFQAILWCFYPIGFVVLFELVLRANDDDGYKAWLALGIEELGRDVAD